MERKGEGRLRITKGTEEVVLRPGVGSEQETKNSDLCVGKKVW